MKLTQEQIRAFHAAVHAGAGNRDAGWYEEREAIFLAGLRMGRAEGREQAAKAALEYLRPRYYPKARAWVDIGEGCANAIRALPEEPT